MQFASLGGRDPQTLEALFGPQRVLQKFAALEEFFLNVGVCFLEVPQEGRAACLAAFVEFRLPFLLLPGHCFHAGPQLFQALCDQLLIDDECALLLAEEEAGFEDFKDEVGLVCDPEGFFDDLRAETGQGGFQVLEEVLDGLAEGVLVDLPEEPSVGVLVRVFDVSLAVLQVVGADGVDGGEARGGRRRGGGEGVEDGCAGEEEGEQLPELFVVGGREGVEGEFFAVFGRHVQTASVVGEFVVDHAHLQQFHLHLQTAPLPQPIPLHPELLALIALLKADPLITQQAAEVVHLVLPQALLVLLHQLFQLFIGVYLFAGRAGQQFLLVGEGQSIQLQQFSHGAFEIGDEHALLEQECVGVAGEVVQQRVLVRLRLLPVDVLEESFLVDLHVLRPQPLPMPTSHSPFCQLPQRAPRPRPHALLPPEEDDEVAVLLGSGGVFAQVDHGEQFYAVVGFLVVVGQLPQPFKAVPPGGEGEGEEDVSVSLPVVLDHPPQALLADFRPRELASQVRLEVELPQLVGRAVDGDGDVAFKAQLHLFEYVLVVPAQQSAEEAEVVRFEHHFFLLVGVEVAECGRPVKVEQLATGGLLHLVGVESLAQLLGQLAVGPAHEAEVLVAVELVLPGEFHEVVGGGAREGVGEAAVLGVVGALAGAGEGGEEGVVGVVGGGGGAGDAGEEVAVVDAEVGEQRVLAGEVVHLQHAFPPSFLLQVLRRDHSGHHLLEAVVDAVRLAAELRTADVYLLGEAEAHVEGVALLSLAAQVRVLLLVPGVLELQPREPPVEFHVGLLLQLLAGVRAHFEVDHVFPVVVGEPYGIALHGIVIMQALANAVFQGFLRELARTPPRSYFNSSRVIQSSVGMIFRVHPAPVPTPAAEGLAFGRIELLFTQRAGYEGDRNAFNIVFPGGQCDGGESDLEACRRELWEEVGLKVEEQCLYLGQLPSNFFYLGKRGKDVFITCHVWCMREDHLHWRERLNPDQLCDSRWVDLAQLLSPANYLVEKSLRLGILERIASKYKLRLIADVSKQVLSISTPELNLGMQRNLWGLTLWLWSYALQMACSNLTREGRAGEAAGPREWVRQMEGLEVEFKDGFVLKYPSLAVIKSWHYFNRLRPFTYRPNPARGRLLLASGLVLLLVVLLLLL